MKIIDNFLPQEQFNLAKAHLLDYGFPWMWNDSVTKNECIADPSEFQFVHSFYEPLCGVVTEYKDWLDIIKPFGDRLNPVSLMRIKANLNIGTSEFITRELHTDFSVPCTTAIVYINTNNGYTIFEDGTKVESIENRIVIFDSHLKHAGVPCTDQKRRVVLNFNFI
tara:strand:- start:76 stop:573 length:498 start_codon:yes stop_codon:yes gene_type:complete